MRILSIDTRDFRTALRADPAPILAKAQADIEEAGKVVQRAGQQLQTAREARSQGFNRLTELNKEFSIVSAALRNSKTLALQGDLNTMWAEVRKNRQRREQLSDLIAYQTLVIQEHGVALQQAEIDVEGAKADLLEAQCAVDRIKIMQVADAARSIDAGSVVSLDDSASAKVLARVDRIRRSEIPTAETKLQGLQEKLMLAKEQAASSLFG
jgi:hypothetical protein